MGSSSSGVTQRWAQPESPSSRADALHPSDSTTPQLPPLLRCLVGREEKPAPDPIRVALPRAGRGCGVGQHRRGRPAPQGIARAGNAASRWYHRSKVAECGEKGCSPLAMLRHGLNWWVLLFGPRSAWLFVELPAAGCYHRTIQLPTSAAPRNAPARCYGSRIANEQAGDTPPRASPHWRPLITWYWVCHSGVTQNPVSARSPCAPLLSLYPQVKVAPESRGRRIRPRTSAATKTQELVLPTNE